jgi:hypothetical protein
MKKCRSHANSRAQRTPARLGEDQSAVRDFECKIANGTSSRFDIVPMIAIAVDFILSGINKEIFESSGW